MVIRIAIVLRLGLPLCRPLTVLIVVLPPINLHRLSCRFSEGHHTQHAALNDIIKRSLESAKVPCHLEPTALYRSHCKRPDGASVVPWRGGKVLVWYVCGHIGPIPCITCWAGMWGHSCWWRTEKVFSPGVHPLLRPSGSGNIGSI